MAHLRAPFAVVDAWAHCHWNQGFKDSGKIHQIIQAFLLECSWTTIFVSGGHRDPLCLSAFSSGFSNELLTGGISWEAELKDAGLAADLTYCSCIYLYLLIFTYIYVLQSPQRMQACFYQSDSINFPQHMPPSVFECKDFSQTAEAVLIERPPLAAAASLHILWTPWRIRPVLAQGFFRRLHRETCLCAHLIVFISMQKCKAWLRLVSLTPCRAALHRAEVLA